MIEVGKEVTWTSQALGCDKTKTGKVIGIVHPGESAFQILAGECPTIVRRSNIKFSKDYTNFDRVLVAVPAGAHGTITHYYCPRMSILTAQGN